MAKKPPRSHRWALEFSPADPAVRALSPEAKEGLEHARELAQAARERRLAALRGISYPRLTVADVAEDYGSPVRISTQIKKARVELFGSDLSDSAIAYRMRKRRERLQRVCAECGCARRIPPLANGRRRYCAEHATPAARVRRHRRCR